MDQLFKIPLRTFPEHFVHEPNSGLPQLVTVFPISWMKKEKLPYLHKASRKLTHGSSRGEYKTPFCISQNLCPIANFSWLSQLWYRATIQQELRCAPRRLFPLICEFFLPLLKRDKALVSLKIISPTTVSVPSVEFCKKTAFSVLACPAEFLLPRQRPGLGLGPASKEIPVAICKPHRCASCRLQSRSMW